MIFIIIYYGDVTIMVKKHIKIIIKYHSLMGHDSLSIMMMNDY